MTDDNRVVDVARSLRALVDAASPGDRLPGVRELSRRYRASAVTVTAAVAQLVTAGLVRAEPGRGTFVTDRATRPEPDYAWQTGALGPARVDADRAARLGGYGSADHVPLSWGYLAPELLPQEDLRRLGARAVRSTRAWAMTPPAGSPDLRRVLAAPYRVDPQDVLVVPGGQAGLVVALRTLAEPGDTVLTESPGYPGALLAAQSAGLHVVSVPADAEGVRVDLLADALERTLARVVVLQPSYANPTGAVLGADRRRELLDLVVRHGAFVVEDDWARHLAIDGPAPAPLLADDAHGHVVTVTTLSKPASPGLRLGAVVARGPAGQRMRAARTADDLGVAPVVQEIAHGLLTSAAWPRHVRRLRTELAARRDALVDALRTTLPEARVTTVPRGGLHLWVRLDHGVDTRALAAAADAAGVLVGDGRHFYVDEPPAPHLRLSFGAASPAQIAEGVRVLGGLLRA